MSSKYKANIMIDNSIGKWFRLFQDGQINFHNGKRSYHWTVLTYDVSRKISKTVKEKLEVQDFAQCFSRKFHAYLIKSMSY